MTQGEGPRLARRTVLSLPVAACALPAAQGGKQNCEEIRRFAAPEARQAVAVDAEHFYAIGNRAIAKYDKKTGRRIAVWECEAGRPLTHLNSGVVRAGVLYCAHSNYPGVPMVSSLEMWDTKTLRHTGSHSFGILAGSATWFDWNAGHWYGTFAHYGGSGGEPNRDPRWTTLLQFDAQWRPLQGWVYPQAVISKQGQYSISGGVFGAGGRILCTGHDEPEIYVLSFPKGGSTLVLEDTFGTPMHGQGIAWDPSSPGTLYGISRATGEVVVTSIRESTRPEPARDPRLRAAAGSLTSAYVPARHGCR